MNKKVAMIPVRLGSKRIKKKNLRLINGKPLISYIIEAAIESEAFDEIYINSESNIFKEIANSHGVKFYKRPEHLSTDSATNDDFVLDFIDNINCDTIIQLLATSPFITPGQIKNFVQVMELDNLDTLISTSNVQIECVYENKPINFNHYKQSPPSQELEPIKAYACGIMGWRCDNYRLNMKEFGCGYHGGNGNIGTFTLTGFSAVDVDNEDDFMLAEVIAKSIAGEVKSEPRYYGEDGHRESDVPSILAKDGVINNDLFDCNKEIVNLSEIISQMGKGSWSKRIVNTENNSATLISQMPGEGNRKHYHDNWNEWWYIVDGEWEWEIEGEKKVVKKGEVVFIEKGKWHKITAIGDKPAIRLAVSREDVDHIYEDER